MDYIISQFEDEVKEAWELYYKDYAEEDDDLDDHKQAFLQEQYNTINKTSCECKDFINNNLTIYLAMEEVVNSEWEEQGYGIVKVVNMWRYMKAEEVIAGISEME